MNVAKVTMAAHTCACGCGEEVRPRKRNASGFYYVNPKHVGAHRTQTYLQEMCGMHLDLAMKYLKFAETHYKTSSLHQVRSALCPFLLYLCESSIADIQKITPATINRYLAWADDLDYQNVRHEISVLSIFFQWTVVEGLRTSASPIVSKFHGKASPKASPRPYSDAEMELIWSCAVERGNDMVRTVLAIGQEAGLRIGEICNLRISDVDLVSQTLHVRLPNKSDTERTAFFSCLTAHHLPIWLEARGACEHDHLFHNSIGRPFQVGTLHATLAKVPRASYYLPAQAIA